MTKVDGEIDGFTFNCMGWNASTQVIIIIIIITSFKIIIITIFLINTNLLSPVNLFSFKATWIGEYLGPTLEVKPIFSQIKQIIKKKLNHSLVSKYGFLMICTF